MEKSRLSFDGLDAAAPATDPELEKRFRQWKQACVDRPDDRFAKEEFLATLKDVVRSLEAANPADERIGAFKRAANVLSEDLNGRPWYP
ncbi:MAG: hypothetical protein FJZ01_08090 [Candidatus Sericytochromatia bacterium]|nr:hypothetical protein [Candidatus Tanganyikabacteria bacterium]